MNKIGLVGLVCEHLLKRIQEVAKSLADAARAPAPTIEVVESSNPVINHSRLAQTFSRELAEKMGKNKVQEIDPVMGGEDFGEYSLGGKIPILYFRVGAQAGPQAGPKEKWAPIHSSKFLPAFEPALKTGVQAMIYTVTRMQEKIHSQMIR